MLFCVSDAGMCGESGGIIGMSPEVVVKKMRSHLPIRFLPAKGACRADGVIFTLDTVTARVTDVTPVSF